MHDVALTAAVILASAFDMPRILAVFEATINFQLGQRNRKRKGGAIKQRTASYRRHVTPWSVLHCPG